MPKPKSNTRGMSTYDKATKALNIASKALTVGVGVAKLLNVEKKYSDKEFNQSVAEDAATINLLNGLAQGDGGTERDGDQAKFLTLQWNGSLHGPTGGETAVAHRLMIVLDKQCDSATPAITDILEQQEWQSPLNMDNKMRFKVLYDKQFLLGVDALTGITNNGSIPSRRLIKHYIKLGKKDMGIRVRYSGTGSTIASLSSNPIYVVQISQGLQSEGSQSYSDLYFRMRYVDN